MTNLENLLLEVDQNQLRIKKFGVFDSKILQKINYKLRLDWNYYSNRMEGGTLTRSETRSVMVGNLDVKGKPFKDVAEMNGHDQIVLDVLKMSKGEYRISEKRIKEIHSAIMYEENLELKKQIANWKSIPNEIINYKDEKISFTMPFDVPNQIHDLLNTVNSQYDQFTKQSLNQHPVVVAADFHLKFVSIHPFYDGNGRMSRILTNILLMSYGFPSVIIKEDAKKGYYQLLADIQAYGGNPELFYAFIAERVLESQQLILSALEGKEIEEADDIDKEISMFKRELDTKELVGTIKKSNEVIAELYLNHLKFFVDHLIEKHKQLDDLFAENSVDRMVNNSYASNYDQSKDYILDQMTNLNSSQNKYEKGIQSFGLGFHHKGFRKDGLNLFDFHSTIYIKFDDFTYQIGPQNKSYATILYSTLISKEELIQIVSDIMKEALAEIKKKIGQNDKK